MEGRRSGFPSSRFERLAKRLSQRRGGSALSSPATRGRGTARRAVEGVRSSRLDHRYRRSDHPVGRVIDRAQHVSRCDPDHSHALRFEPSVPPHVSLRPIFRFVAHSVDLDGEARVGAEEVKHVWADGMLPSKGRQSGRANPQPAP